MKANNGSGVVVLDAMRCPAGVDIISYLQQSRPLVVIARDQPSVLTVSKRRLVDGRWEVGRFIQIFRADSVEVVATVLATWRVAETKIAGLKLQTELASPQNTIIYGQLTCSEYVFEVKYQRPVAGSITPVPETPTAG